jgi:hypothetical protein
MLIVKNSVIFSPNNNSQKFLQLVELSPTKQAKCKTYERALTVCVKVQGEDYINFESIYLLYAIQSPQAEL